MEKKHNMFQTTNQNIIWYFMDIFSRHVHRFSHGFPIKRPGPLRSELEKFGPRDGFAAHVEELRDLLAWQRWSCGVLNQKILEISMMCITTEKGGKHKKHIYIYIHIIYVYIYNIHIMYVYYI